MINISPDRGFNKKGLAAAVAAYRRLFTAAGRNMGNDVKQWLLYLYGPTDVDGDDATGEADDVKEKVDELLKLIIKLNTECLVIVATLKPPWDSRRGILPDKLVVKQKLIGDAVERREVILEKYRCDRVVKEFESLHPPTLCQCPTCFTDTPQWDFAFNECCGKAACNSCIRCGELSSCPLCGRGRTINNIQEVKGIDNLQDVKCIDSVQKVKDTDSIDSIQDVKDIKKIEDINNAMAQHSMGKYCLKGKGPFRGDVKGGLKFIHLAAEQGISVAIHELALLYDGCDGVTTDGEKVVRYTKEAAWTGLPLAQWRMAELLMTGRFGVRKDEKESIKYLTLAAQCGCEIAQGHLGMKFVATGQLERAKYWLEKATRAEDFEIRANNQPALVRIIVNLSTRVYWSRHGLSRSRFEERPSHSPKEKKKKKKKKSRKTALLRKAVKKVEVHGIDLQRTEDMCIQEDNSGCYPWFLQLETAARIVTYWKGRHLLLKLQGGATGNCMTMNSYGFDEHTSS